MLAAFGVTGLVDGGCKPESYKTRLSGTRMRCSIWTIKQARSKTTVYPVTRVENMAIKSLQRRKSPVSPQFGCRSCSIMLGPQDNDPKRARLCRTAPLTHWSVGIQVQTILTSNPVFTLFYKPQYRPKKSSSARQVGGAFFSPVARSICLPYRASIILDARLLN